MKTVVRMFLVAALLSSAAASCVLSYMAGYSEGLRIQAKWAEPPMRVLQTTPTDPELITLEAKLEIPE